MIYPAPDACGQSKMSGPGMSKRAPATFANHGKMPHDTSMPLHPLLQDLWWHRMQGGKSGELLGFPAQHPEFKSLIPLTQTPSQESGSLFQLQEIQAAILTILT